MIRRILIPIDASVASQSALSIAGSLAGIIRAELIGLYVEDEARFQDFSVAAAIAQNLTGEAMIAPILAPDELLKREAAVEAESLKIYELFQQRCESAGIEGRFLSLRGNPEMIIQERSRTVDFIVIGNSVAHDGVETLQKEGMINALVRGVTCPVLVVPEEALGENCVVIAYDGSRASERALRAAAEFADMTDMDQVHILTVSSSIQEAKDIQKPALEYLAAYGLLVTPITETGKPEELILNYVNKVDCSVLVLGAFGSNRMKEAIFGSTTQAVLRNADAAVLLVS